MRLVHFPSARLSRKRDEDIVHATSMVNLWSLVPETTSGGNAIPFYASVRLRVSSKPSSDTPNTLAMKVKVVKNKVAPALNKVAEFQFECAKGTDKIMDVIGLAKDMGFVRFAGSAVKWQNPSTSEEETLCTGGKLGLRSLIEEKPAYFEHFKLICTGKESNWKESGLLNDELQTSGNASESI